MKNITLSVDDAVYQAARVEAAKRNRSLSGIVRAYLQAFAQGTAPVLPAPEADRENREKLVRLLSECRLELGYRPSRAKTYEGGRFSRSTEDLNAGQIYAGVKVVNPFSGLR